MRRLFIILMIMLLPLQGWASVTMSTEMATMQLSMQSHSAATSTMEISLECALRMSAANIQDTENDDASNKVCSDCQACHLIALAELVQIISKTTFNRSFERSARHYFVSADLQHSQKPPIFFI